MNQVRISKQKTWTKKYMTVRVDLGRNAVLEDATMCKADIILQYPISMVT